MVLLLAAGYYVSTLAWTSGETAKKSLGLGAGVAAAIFATRLLMNQDFNRPVANAIGTILGNEAGRALTVATTMTIVKAIKTKELSIPAYAFTFLGTAIGTVGVERGSGEATFMGGAM